MDFIKIKKIIILLLALPVMYFAAINLNSVINAPDIKNINIPDMTDFSFNTIQNSVNETSKNLADKISDESKAHVKAEQRKKLDENVARAKIEAAKEMHFVPTFLLTTVLACSGALAVMSYRDMFGTGKKKRKK